MDFGKLAGKSRSSAEVTPEQMVNRALQVTEMYYSVFSVAAQEHILESLQKEENEVMVATVKAMIAKGRAKS